jgi:hypothetical protein
VAGWWRVPVRKKGVVPFSRAYLRPMLHCGSTSFVVKTIVRCDKTSWCKSWASHVQRKRRSPSTSTCNAQTTEVNFPWLIQLSRQVMRRFGSFSILLSSPLLSLSDIWIDWGQWPTAATKQ